MENKEQPLNKKIIRHQIGYDAIRVEDLKHTLKRLQDKLRNCDAFFDVKQHQGSISTDKFMNIVSIFLREVFGAELLEEKKR